MLKLHGDLAAVASEIEIVSATRYSFRGEPRETAALAAFARTEAGQPVAFDGVAPPLVSFVESELYQRAYRRPADGVARSVVAGGADHAFVLELSRANCGAGTWEAGWTVVEATGDLVGVAKDIVCWVPPSEVRGELTRGARCRVKVAKELRHLVLGYYLALGDAEPPEPPEPADDSSAIRLYWALTARSAVRYIELATKLLNDRQIVFRTKVVAHSALYQNADAGVMYLTAHQLVRAGAALHELYEALAGELRPTTPMFTRPLAPGLGFAEDPQDGLSFGQSRCRLVAQGLWAAHLAGANTALDRQHAIAACFERAGIDPARPYLRSGTNDLTSMGSLYEDRAQHSE